MNPDAGDGNGTVTSWLTSAVPNWLKLPWKSLLKWAECDCSPGSVASLSTTSPRGPNRFVNNVAACGDRDRQVERLLRFNALRRGEEQTESSNTHN